MHSREQDLSRCANANRRKTIGLCVIVKNEANVITRCLESVRHFVDFVLVEDTGSTDGTQQIISEWFKQNSMPGVVVEESWRDFAYNRSHALTKLREIETVDYALIMDADDMLVVEEGFEPAAFKASMQHDLYDVQVRHGTHRLLRPQLCSNTLGFFFQGVLHEYLEAPPGEISRANAAGFYIATGPGGVRSRNPKKYEDDAAALEKALLTETDPFLISRYTFYLAQSYRDCEEHEKALANYLKRATLGYWAEEVFESLYNAAKLKETLDFPEDEVIAAYLRAAEAATTRAEALHGAARYCRIKGRYEQGYQYAKRGLDISLPGQGLFLEPWIYGYGLLDELAINGYWCGHYHESLDASLRILEETAAPAEQRDRIARNARFALEKLPRDANPGSIGKETPASDQRALVEPRPLCSRIVGAPKVLLAILARQKEKELQLYLDCIEALDYPKTSIVLYVRTNNNTDGTERILRQWLDRQGHKYAAVVFDATDVEERVQDFKVHEWNATRFRVLGEIRNISLRRTAEHACDYYFVADVDNFIRPVTLRELVALDLPIVAPFLRSPHPGSRYSNYHAKIDSQGYYCDCDQYLWILNQWMRGVIEVPAVHSSYLIRADVLNELTYEDGSDRYNYMIFSESARKSGKTQYLDNRQLYGYIAVGKSSEQHRMAGVGLARSYLSEELNAYRHMNQKALISRHASAAG